MYIKWTQIYRYHADLKKYLCNHSTYFGSTGLGKNVNISNSFNKVSIKFAIPGVT